MENSDLLLFYTLVKNFVDAVDSDEKLRDLVFEIDGCGNLEDLFNIDSSDVDFLNFGNYIANIEEKRIEIHCFFYDKFHTMIFNDMRREQESLKEFKDFTKYLNSF